MTLVNEQNEEAVQNWLRRELQNLSDAEPDLLSQYVLALLKDSGSKGEDFKYKCRDSLQEFIGDHTNSFVDRMFGYLHRLNNSGSGSSSSQKPLETQKTQNRSPSPPPKRKYAETTSSSSSSRRDPTEHQPQKRQRTEDYNGSNRRRDYNDDHRQDDDYNRTRKDSGRRRDYDSYESSGRSYNRYDNDDQSTSDSITLISNGQSYNDDSDEGRGDKRDRSRGTRGSRTVRGRGRGYDDRGDGRNDREYRDRSDRGRGERGRGSRGRGRGRGRGYDEQPPITGETYKDKNGNEIIVLNKELVDPTNDSRLPSLNTLIISSIPDETTLDAVHKHFSKFGSILNVMIKMHSHKAFVQFETADSAKRAVTSPDAVLGNRFIKVYWAPKIEEPVAVKPVPEPISTEKVKELTQITQKRSDLLNEQIAMYKTLLEKIDAMKEPSKDKLELVKYAQQLSESITKLQQEQQASAARLQRNIVGATPAVAKKDQSETIAEDKTETDKGSTSQEEADDQTPATEGVRPQSAFAIARGRGTYIRGADRGRGRGSIRGRGGIVKRSLTLDNRTTTVHVKGIPQEGRDESTVRQHFEQFGEIQNIEFEPANDAYNIKFANRNNAQKAMELGKSYNGAQLKFQWKMQPRTEKVDEIEDEDKSDDQPVTV